MKKVLITGASGFLGWNLYKTKPDDVAYYGMANSKSIDLPEAHVTNLDLTNQSKLIQLINDLQPDGIIHTAATVDANYCQQHREESQKINIEASIALAQAAADLKIPFVFTSTDLVFDGKKGDYIETDSVNPLSIYGEQKVKAEEEILAIHPDAAICRMPLMFGASGVVATGNLQRFLIGAKSGKPMKLFTDEYRTPLGGASAARGLWLALEKFRGIYHLGGPTKMNRLEIGEMITSAFKVTDANLVPIKQADLEMAAPRPADVSLNSSKAMKAGFSPLCIKEELDARIKSY